MLNESEIKNIIINVKQTNTVDPNIALQVICAYVYEKKEVDLTKKNLQISHFEMDKLMQAFSIAMDYYASKYELITLSKVPLSEQHQPEVIKAWFPN